MLATVGSLGDLHPFIALARALQQQGATVLIATAAEYQSKVEGAGVAFAAVRPSFAQIEADLGMSRAELTHRCIAHPTFLFRKLVLPYLQHSYEDLLRLTQGTDLFLTSSLAFGARLAAEKRSVPWIGIALQPFLFLSAYDPPVIAQAPWFSRLLRRLPVRARAGLLAALKSMTLPLLRPVRRLREQIGLPASRDNPLFDGQFSVAGAIGLYSELLEGVPTVRIPPDYPQPMLIAGFAWFDSADGVERDLDPALHAFVETGDPPLVFTLGSLIVHAAGDFYRHSAAAARAVRRRAVLLVGETQLAACQDLAACDVFVTAYAPHSRLFARAAAVVHHGGIGTLAQALRAGHPQLIVPYFADQPDNAARAARLGVAQVLAPRRYTAPLAAAQLRQLLDDPAIALQARAVAERIAAQDGATTAARAIIGAPQATAAATLRKVLTI